MTNNLSAKLIQLSFKKWVFISWCSYSYKIHWPRRLGRSFAVKFLSEKDSYPYKCSYIFFRSIIVPEKRKGTTTAKQFVMVVIVYMASLLLVFPLVLLGLDVARTGIPFKRLSIPYFCYAWLVPFVSFTVMVFVVFMKLRKGISGRVIGGEESDNMLREKKATKNSVMITTIIAFQFFLLTFPYQLVHFLPLKLQVISWVECVSYLNGCIKPVIIALTFRSIKNEEPLRGESSHRNVRKGFEPFTNETFAGDDFAETKHWVEHIQKLKKTLWI